MNSSHNSQQELTIRVLHPDGEQAMCLTFPPQETISIGRSSESDVSLKDFGWHISRCHAAILNDGEHWEYYSLGMNGTFRDGVRVDTLEIESNLELRLGRSGPIIQFLLNDPEPLASQASGQ